MFRQSDADADAGKWLPDPFQACVNAATVADAKARSE